MDPATARTLISSTGSRVKIIPKKVDKESPEYIKEQVEQSFRIAALNLKEANRLKHPSKRNVKLVESFPILPDLNAFPDAGGYVSVKFLTNPVPPSNVYDRRLEAGVLRPLAASDEKLKARDDAMAAHERDPNRNPYPDVDQDYEFFLLDTPADAANFKRKYDIMNPDNDDDDLYTHVSEQKHRCFRFKRVRAYETASMVGAMETKYEDDIAITINRVEDSIHQRAAYFYPLIQRSTIRPQRKKNIDRQKWGFADQGADEADSVDLIDVTIRDATAKEVRERRVWIESPYHVVEDDMDVVADDHDGGAAEGNEDRLQESIDGQGRMETVENDDDDEAD